MRLVAGPEALSREDLQANWHAWVLSSLGRDPGLAAIATEAAVEAAASGSGFNAAADAARAAWSHANGTDTLKVPAGSPPWTIRVAMGVAIGGAAVSAPFCLWFAVNSLPYFESVASYFLVYNLGLVALNAWLLYEMWHHARWAWRAAIVLLIVGAIFDLVGVFVPPFLFVDLGAAALLTSWFPNQVWLFDVGLVWLWVHLVVIQVPILVLLQAAPSRAWFPAASPASIPNSETPA